MQRAECLQHVQVLRNVPEPCDGQGDKPDEGNWTKERSNPASAFRLHGEEANENQRGQRHDVGFECGSGDF